MWDLWDMYGSPGTWDLWDLWDLWRVVDHCGICDQWDLRGGASRNFGTR